MNTPDEKPLHPRTVVFNFDFTFEKSFMCLEVLRCYSFRNAPPSFDIGTLVRSGFYYNGKENVACAFCDYNCNHDDVLKHDCRRILGSLCNIKSNKSPFFGEYLANVAYLTATEKLNDNNPTTLYNESDILTRHADSRFLQAVKDDLPMNYVENIGADAARYPFVLRNGSPTPHLSTWSMYGSGCEDTVVQPPPKRGAFGSMVKAT